MPSYAEGAFAIAKARAERFERLVAEVRRELGSSPVTKEQWEFLSALRREVASRREALSKQQGKALDRDTELIAAIRKTEADHQRVLTQSRSDIRIAESRAAVSGLESYEKDLRVTPSAEARERRSIDDLAISRPQLHNEDFEEAYKDFKVPLRSLIDQRQDTLDAASTSGGAALLIEQKDLYEDVRLLVGGLHDANPNAPIWTDINSDTVDNIFTELSGFQVPTAEGIERQRQFERKQIEDEARIRGVGGGSPLKLTPEERLGLPKGADYTHLSEKAAFNKLQQRNPGLLEDLNISTFEEFRDSTDERINLAKDRMHPSIREILIYGDEYSDEALAILERERELEAYNLKFRGPGTLNEEEVRQEARRREIRSYGTVREKRKLSRLDDLADVSAEVFSNKNPGEVRVWAERAPFVDNKDRRRFLKLTRRYPLTREDRTELGDIIDRMQSSILQVKVKVDDYGEVEEKSLLVYLDEQLASSTPWTPADIKKMEDLRDEISSASLIDPSQINEAASQHIVDTIDRKAVKRNAGLVRTPVSVQETMEAPAAPGAPAPTEAPTEAPTPTGAPTPGHVNLQAKMARDRILDKAMAEGIGTLAYDESQKQNIAPSARETIEAMAKEFDVSLSKGQLSELTTMATLDKLDEKSKEDLLDKIFKGKPQDKRVGRLGIGVYRSLLG